MRGHDLSPLYRSTVGFDRLFQAFDQLASEPADTYPPYDIVKTADDSYAVTLAVAGFDESELSVETREGVLTVRGQRKPETDKGREFLHRGIAARTFERRFRLADHVTVTEARVENGLLHVGLVREIPEAAKPRRIEIARAGEARAPEALAA